jgi:uncharacterized membrane protein HdeD (DUF308 family)
METLIARRWWLLTVRGVAALIFGVVVLARPAIGLYALVALFGAYAMVDGIFSLALGIRSAAQHVRWGAMLLEGIAGLVAGVLAFAWPQATAVVLLALIAAWAIVTGVAELAAAIVLRRYVHGEWLLVLSGCLSVAFGIVLLRSPGVGALALLLWIGAYAIVFGVVLIALSLRLRGALPDRMRGAHLTT